MSNCQFRSCRGEQRSSEENPLRKERPRLRWILSFLGCGLLATVAFPLCAEIPLKVYGQHLVDEAVVAHPELLVVMMHVTPPGSSTNLVIASNIGRIGKEGDGDDLRVIWTGVAKTEVANNGKRFEVELPLLDVSGEIIGALGLVFPYTAGDDQRALAAKATAIRDELAKRIWDAGNLLEQYPFDPRATTKTHAQKLVDLMLVRHSDLLAMSLHVTPPNGSESITLASNIGRIGKKTDGDLLKVAATGAPAVGAGAALTTTEVGLVLHDVSGHAVGVLALVFASSTGDEAALVRRGERIRDELGAQIPSVQKLVELDP